MVRTMTIARTTITDNLKNAYAAAAAGHPSALSSAQLVSRALATGYSPAGFLTAAGIALVELLTVLATVQVRRQDLTGAEQWPPLTAEGQPAGARQQNQVVLAAAVCPCRHCQPAAIRRL